MSTLGDEERWDAISKAFLVVANEMMNDSVGWFGEDVAYDLVTTTLGINGEAGEVADILKKMMRGSLSEQEALPLYCEELVDTLIYVLLAARTLGFDIIQGYREKRAYNQRRYSNAGGTDQPDLYATVRRQQQSPLGASAFVAEGSLQQEVHEDPKAGR